MALLEGKFVVDGVHWDYFPSAWEAMLTDEYGVRSSVANTLNLTSIVVAQTSIPTDLVPDAEKRLVHRQAWKASWDQNGFMDVCMRDQLVMLYTLQKGFWIQYDDEMSREAAQLIPADTGRKTFFTPTYPVAPYGYTPVAPTSYNGTVFMNGTPIWDGFTVYNELGKITFENQLPTFVKVYMKYTWKAFVRIANLSIKPLPGLAQDIYEAEVVFEQITPNITYDPWWVTFNCTNCPNVGGANLAGGGGITPANPLSLPNPQWWDTRYSVASGTTNPSGASGASGVSVASGVSLTSGFACPSGYTAVNCLVHGTPIELYDGTTTTAERIKVGDKLKGFDEIEQVVCEQTVYETFGGLQPCIKVDTECGSFTASLVHRVYTKRGVLMVRDLCGTDTLVGYGYNARILELSWAGYKAVSGWNCTPNHNFFVDGLLHHNKQNYCVQVNAGGYE